jgi:two-component system chemotaxis sensor kinase CheA
MDMSQYLEIFIEESKEHLQNMSQSLLQLEKDPGDTSVLNEIFRAAHTLKGMSGTMGFNSMQKLTHTMEDVLQALRNSEINVTPNLVDLMFKCLDALEKYVDSVVNTSSEGEQDNTALIEGLKNAKNSNGQAEPEKPVQVAAQPVSTATTAADSEHPTANFTLNEYDMNVINKAYSMDMNAYKITLVLNKGCLLKSARSFIIFQTLERYSEIIKSQPKVEDIEDEKFDFSLA